MIEHPKDWQKVGREIGLTEVGEAIRQSILSINCNCLSFSGGLDSSLLLHFMLEAGRKVQIFNGTCSQGHPDTYYSQLAVRFFESKFNTKITGQWFVIDNATGNKLVKAFYKLVGQHTDSIIAGDGIDEFAGGYYDHQEKPYEFRYFYHMRKLQLEQLAPLDKNSGTVRVHLPYLDTRVTSLLWQIPLSEKVDATCRKKLMVQLAEGKLPREIIDRRKYGFGTRGE